MRANRGTVERKAVCTTLRTVLVKHRGKHSDRVRRAVMDKNDLRTDGYK